MFSLPDHNMYVFQPTTGIINKPSIIDGGLKIPPKVINDPPHKNTDKYLKTGRYNLNGHSYELGFRQSIDSVRINTPDLYAKDEVLYYMDDDGSNYYVLRGSLMEQALLTAVAKYKQSKDTKVPTNKITPGVKQNVEINRRSVLEGNKVSNVDYITMQKFKEPQTVLQKHGGFFILMASVGVAIYYLNK